MLEGTKVSIDGQEWIVQPMKLKGLKKLLELEAAISTMSSSTAVVAVFDRVCDVVAMALKPNYPQITAEQIEDMLEFQEIGTVLFAIAQASGLSPPGELQGGSTSSGVTSTA